VFDFIYNQAQAQLTQLGDHAERLSARSLGLWLAVNKRMARLSSCGHTRLMSLTSGNKQVALSGSDYQRTGSINTRFSYNNGEIGRWLQLGLPWFYGTR
jgi:hypothetical protein